ncbi:hypothetical protein [Microseira wollei]|uniref:Uncharacterized protein n=1 Tax=Microseira wollei NIES-4236 TaxID=2530354 RepID=A0AAV3X523_9CYAN|nr:hypothetical protein [Microseira wollei]GET36418.1 hypothetical protein MiSe_11690 [Microseira wollei NIES-4236]
MRKGLIGVRSLLKIPAIFAILGAVSAVAVLAQDQLSFKNFSIETLSRLNGECRGSTEVNYRSQRLRSPDGKTSIYFNGVIRRVGQNTSRRGGVGSIKCDPYKLETPAGELVIESETILTKNLSDLGFERRFNGFYIVNPVAFSPDSRYLIARVDVSSNGLDAWTGYAVLDSQKDYQLLSLDPCKDTDFGGEYKGFTSPFEIIFDCSAAGEVYFEVLNLTRQSISRIPSRSSVSNNQIRSYGSVFSTFEIVRVQQFPRQ